jgi:pyruvate/2-oxoglutarate dehydrogenase complex dihydrolipoamide acyltransferase (E2) component
MAQEFDLYNLEIGDFVNRDEQIATIETDKVLYT